MKLLTNIIVAVASTLLIASCSHSGKWSVSGNITGADGKLVVLERSFNGMWNTVDSMRLDKSGKYHFVKEPAGYADIYRLTVDGKSAYFPVDSIEDVVLNGDYTTWSTAYTVEGSQDAELMQQANDIINSYRGTDILTDSVAKGELSKLILGNMGSIVSYYLINKEVGGKPIFNPYDKKDLRVIGAVVNAFSSQRHGDPRTRILTESYLAARRALNKGNNPVQVEATEIAFPEINLTGADGKQHSLTQLAGNGKPVILNFTAYTTEFSPAVNVALASIYNEGGVDIYQVSIDTDEHAWREAARNLPWTTVLRSPRDGERVLQEYNVSSIPMSYIIDREGRLQERVDDIAKLKDIVKKYK